MITHATEIPGKEIATLGGGCFWCLEAVFDRLQGVDAVESGYTGGDVLNPTYEEVCGGRTGHAEVVRVTYDPDVVSFRDLLAVFFAMHDPTTLNRQGNDAGTQYRSAIFYHSPEQQAAAQEAIARLTAGKVYRNPIVTEVSKAPEFYVAEKDHQEYFDRNGSQPYCQFVVAPKVAKLKESFASKLKR